MALLQGRLNDKFSLDQSNASPENAPLNTECFSRQSQRMQREITVQGKPSDITVRLRPIHAGLVPRIMATWVLSCSLAGFGGFAFAENAADSLDNFVELRDSDNIAAPFQACINIGGYLEAPALSAPDYWGLVLERSDLDIIARAGFDSIRLPVRWSDYSKAHAPYTIEAHLLEKVERIVSWTRFLGLKTIINVHHFDALYRNVDNERARFLSIWRQLVDHFNGPDYQHVIFEVLNEARDDSGSSVGATIERTDELNRQVLEIIRERSADRWVLLSTGLYGGLEGLRLASPPVSDRRTLLSLHYYDPFEFTHQGAEFIEPTPPQNIRWGTQEHKQKIEADFRLAAALRDRLDMPLVLGEFGVIADANTDGVGPTKIVADSERAQWTRFVREKAEQHGFAWCYWDYAATFGAYEKETQRWKPEILDALVPQSDGS